MKTTLELSVQKRKVEMKIHPTAIRILLKVSREKCNDVLLEIVDSLGNAKNKPLNKYLPQIKLNKEMSSLRFTMKDFSTTPITIEILFK